MIAYLRAALILSLSLLLGCTGVPDGIHPVRGFDAQRYLGIWHEIARLDHRFERGLTGISATYTAREDGGIDVLNRGYDNARGEWREALGHAYFNRGRDIASLKVSFFGPFYGGYHVFALDPDYQWALVSGPSRNYLWILARHPRLPTELMGQLVETARQAGFDTDALIYPAPRLREAESPRQSTQLKGAES